MTSPNPMVGAVIVKGNRVVGEGYHRKAGADHAEIVALRKAGKRAVGATLYVTLEPCCHQGLTGPCTEAIIRAGVKRVVYAVADPDPRITGRGERALKRAGIAVMANVLRAEAMNLNEPHFHYNRTGRPLVTLKLAQSIDGCIATKSGDSKWIGGIESRRWVHRLRSEVDAVMVGGETARRDNPLLSVRLVRGRNPYRIVVSANGLLPRSLSLFRNNSDMRSIVACLSSCVKYLGKTLTNSHTILWEVKPKAGRLDLSDLLGKAGEFGIRHILVEGGSRLATSLLRCGFVDRYVAIISPRIIGQGKHAVGELNVLNVSNALSGTIESVEHVGQDIRVELRLKSRANSFLRHNASRSVTRRHATAGSAGR